MMLNFITALSWIFGVISFFGVAVQFIPPINQGDVLRAGRIFFFGAFPWAWLIARYLL